MRAVVPFLLALAAQVALAETRLYEGEFRVLEREGIKCSPGIALQRKFAMVVEPDAQGGGFALALFGGPDLPAAEFRGDPAQGFASRPSGNPPRSMQQLTLSAFTDDRVAGRLTQELATPSVECRTRLAELELVRVPSDEGAAEVAAQLRTGIAAMEEYSKAYVANERRDFAAAERILEPALASTQGKPYLLYQRRYLALMKVRALTAQHRDREAIAFARQVHAEYEAALGPDHPLTIFTLVELAGAQSVAVEPQPADSAERAYALAVRVHGEKHPETIEIRRHLALAIRPTDPERAMAIFEETIPMVESVYGSASPQAIAIVTPAVAQAASLGYLHKAIAWSDHLIASCERAPGGLDARHQAAIVTNAAVLAYLGRHAQAIERAKLALSLAERNPVPNEADLLFAIELSALIESARSNHAAAIGLLERELVLVDRPGDESHPALPRVLRYLAETKRKSGDARAAATLFARAQRLLGSPGPAGESLLVGATTGLGVALAELGEFDAARVELLRAASLAASMNDARLLGAVDWGWYEYFRAKGALEAAIFFGKSLIDRAQQLRTRSASLSADLRASLAESLAPNYREVADLLVQAGRLPEAQAILALLKEDELQEFTSRDARAPAAQARVELTRSETEAQQKLGSSRERVAALGAELESIRARSGKALVPGDEKRREEIAGELRSANAAFLVALDSVIAAFATAPAERNREIGEKNLLALKALQGTLRELGEGTVAIHFVVASDRLHAILTTPAVQLVRTTTITEAELNRQVFTLRRQLGSPGGDPIAAAKALHRLLIAPIADDLEQAGAQSLLVSLDGTLRYIPLATLHDGDRYLVERFRVSILTDAARGSLKDRPGAHWTMAGLGVTRGFPGFSPLPAVREELDAIVRAGNTGVIPGERYFDEDFDLKRLRAMLEQRRPVLHIASHFVFQPGTEDDSFLLLGTGERLSLRTMRIEGIDFNGLDLLTLSACDTATGGGRDGNGREIEGFGALAQRQGAKSVLATLWQVADASTARLMRRLYELRETDGLGKAEALRRAQLELLADKRYSHPFFWGPFILMGNAL